MEVLNLDEFTSSKPAKAAPAYKLQQFNLKYRNGTFTISNKQFAALGLVDHSLKLVIHPVSKKAVFVVVGDSEGEVFRRTAKTGEKKFKTFKSNTLEDALAASGIIEKTVKVEGEEGKNQLLDLVPTQTTAGSTVYVVEKAADFVEPEAGATPASEAPADDNKSAAPVEETASTTDAASYAQEPPAEDLIATTLDMDEAPDTAQAEDEDFDEKF